MPDYIWTLINNELWKCNDVEEKEELLRTYMEDLDEHILRMSNYPWEYE